VRVLFFGTPDFGVPALKALVRSPHDVAGVVAQPDRPAGRGKKMQTSAVGLLAKQQGIEMQQPRRIRADDRALKTLNAIRPDLNVVVAYGQIIPKSIIYLPTFNSVNLHFSLLPAYRGAAPVQWAILRGEERTGVTIFELDEQMDEGPILAQREVPILDGENAQQLTRRLADIGADLMLKTIAEIHRLEPRSQDSRAASYAPLLTKQDGRIKWTEPAEVIERQIRALEPWPSSFAFFKKRRIKIRRARVQPPEEQASGSLGTVSNIQPEGIDICCGAGSILRIQEVQPENKPSMSAHAFSLGAQIRPGDNWD